MLTEFVLTEFGRATIIIVVAYLVLTVIAFLVAGNRKDDTPVGEVILLCIFLTPVLAIVLEMLKPYRPYGQLEVLPDKSKKKENS